MSIAKADALKATDNQRKTIEAGEMGIDVFGYSLTGSGKSLTFELAPSLSSVYLARIGMPLCWCVGVLNLKEKLVYSLPPENSPIPLVFLHLCITAA